MQTTESQAVIRRFFEALYALKARKDIRGKQTFTNIQHQSLELEQP